MNRLKNYWASQRQQTIGSAFVIVPPLIAALICWFRGSPPWATAWWIAISLGAAAHFGFVVATYRVSAFLLCAALLGAQLDLRAQDVPNGPTEPFQFYTGLEVSMPQYPDPQVDRLGIVGVGVCVGGLAIVAGYIGVKILSACMKIWENQVTNNANIPFQQQDAGPPSFPILTNFHPVTTPAGCEACNAMPAAGQPLPILIEHSFDNQQWRTVTRGISVGQELVLPDTGFWRAQALPVTMAMKDDVLMVHAPPGVLEHSEDLKTWQQVSSSATDSELPAVPGFYRVRLN